MKFKVALVAVFIVGLTASLALAAPSTKPGGTNTTTTKKSNKGKKPVCAPRVALILKGKLASVAGDNLSFTMDVKQANKLGKAYKGKTGVIVTVNANTKIMRRGHKVTLDKLTVGDILNVQARVCKKASGDPAPPLAKRVTAKPAPQTS
jgi:hypothetical protein